MLPVVNNNVGPVNFTMYTLGLYL